MFLLHCVVCIVAAVVSIVLGAALPNAPWSTFLMPSLLSAVAAVIVCRRISDDGARWVWIPFTLLIAYNYTNYPPAQTMGQHLANMWTQVFGSDCGGTECLGQLFLGVPFVGSVVYALTSVVLRWDASEAGDSDGS